MTEDPRHAYEEGVRDGRLNSLEETARRAHERIDRHDQRISAQERITYALLGALALLQIWPAIQGMLT